MIEDELANRISLFYAYPTPMLKTVTDVTALFVAKVSDVARLFLVSFIHIHHIPTCYRIIWVEACQNVYREWLLLAITQSQKKGIVNAPVFCNMV